MWPESTGTTVRVRLKTNLLLADRTLKLDLEIATWKDESLHVYL